MNRALALLALALAAALAAASAESVGPRGMICDVPAKRDPPASVRDLRPQDVELVGALGDSITAAFAVEGGLWEYRDESWSIGAGPNTTTLFNYLKHFNPAVAGGSTKDHFPEVHHQPHSYPTDHLNAAQSGAKVADLVAEQVPYLVEQLKAIPGADKKWKVLTLWIAANDICDSCTAAGTGNGTETVANFAKAYEATLAAIHSQIPRVFVNLITTMPLSALAKIDAKVSRCVVEHHVFTECTCIFKGTEQDWARMDNMTDGYNAAIHRLAAKYNALDDQSAFVVQPFLEGSIIPDESYVSTLDCFHPSHKAHGDLATILWNQMLTPLDKKVSQLPSDEWYQDPACPNATAVFYSQ